MRLAPIVLLVVPVFVSFWPVLGNGFIELDDNVVIFRNAYVAQGFTADSLRWALSSLDGWNWVPVTRIAHLLNVELFGLRPGLHHLMSVLWHVAAAVLLLLALRRVTGRAWLALAVAALFALHPLRVESVAWAAELKDPLSGCLLSLTLLAYARYVERPTRVRGLAVTAVFGLGLLAKPTLVPLPFVLLLLDWWPLGRLGRRALLEKIPLLLLSAAAGAATYAAQAGGRAVSTLDAVSLRARIGNALTGFPAYLGDFFWPCDLAVIYPHRGEGFSTGAALAGAALLLVLTGLVLRRPRRRPWLAVGWFWFLAFLAPVLGLVQVGIQSRADRYTYLPFIGIALALCREGARFLASPRQRARAAAAVAVALVALAAASRCGAGFWKDDESLFGHALAVAPDHGPALAHLGAARFAAGRLDEAVELLRRSVALFPRYAFAHNALGNALSRLGREEEATASYRSALRLRPGWAVAHNNLGASLAATGRHAEAALHFKAALAAQPDMAEAAGNLQRLAPFLRQ